MGFVTRSFEGLAPSLRGLDSIRTGGVQAAQALGFGDRRASGGAATGVSPRAPQQTISGDTSQSESALTSKLSRQTNIKSNRRNLLGSSGGGLKNLLGA